MKGKDRVGLNVSAYILLGLAIFNSLAHAGFESETKVYTDVLLGNIFHYIAGIVFAYWAIPSFKQNDWGGILSRAGVVTAADVLASQIVAGSLATYFKG